MPGAPAVPQCGGIGIRCVDFLPCCNGLTCGESGYCVFPTATPTSSPTPAGPTLPLCGSNGFLCADDFVPCCSGYECLGDTCQPTVPPPCPGEGFPCGMGTDCCSGYKCLNNVCIDPTPAPSNSPMPGAPAVPQCGSIGILCVNFLPCCNGLTCGESGYCTLTVPTAAPIPTFQPGWYLARQVESCLNVCFNAGGCNTAVQAAINSDARLPFVIDIMGLSSAGLFTSNIASSVTPLYGDQGFGSYNSFGTPMNDCDTNAAGFATRICCCSSFASDCPFGP